MAKSNVIELAGREASADPLTGQLRIGSKRLIYQAVEAEPQELLAQHSERRAADGKAGVVRNGYLPEGEIQTGVCPVTVRRTGLPHNRVRKHLARRALERHYDMSSAAMDLKLAGY